MCSRSISAFLRVCQLSQVMRRMTSVITRPITGCELRSERDDSGARENAQADEAVDARVFPVGDEGGAL